MEVHRGHIKTVDLPTINFGQRKQSSKEMIILPLGQSLKAINAKMLSEPLKEKSSFEPGYGVIQVLL
jgi:hypothetical protein